MSKRLSITFRKRSQWVHFDFHNSCNRANKIRSISARAPGFPHLSF